MPLCSTGAMALDSPFVPAPRFVPCFWRFGSPVKHYNAAAVRSLALDMNAMNTYTDMYGVNT